MQTITEKNNLSLYDTGTLRAVIEKAKSQGYQKLIMRTTLAEALLNELEAKDAELEQQLAESHRALRAETTAHDHVKMQLEKLAAENAGLKDALEWLYETVSSESVSIPDEKYSSVTNTAQVLSETPATDAFLAEVRAQGVESAGEYLKQYAQGLHEEARLVLQDAGELCNGFAAQLRKGVRS